MLRDLGDIGGRDAFQHLHEVALDVDLEQIDGGQAGTAISCEIVVLAHRVGNQFALVAQLVDPGQRRAVENGAAARGPRRLVQHQFPAGLARHREVEAGGVRHLAVDVARDVFDQIFMGRGARLVGKMVRGRCLRAAQIVKRPTLAPTSMIVDRSGSLICGWS